MKLRRSGVQFEAKKDSFNFVTIYALKLYSRCIDSRLTIEWIPIANREQLMTKSFIILKNVFCTLQFSILKKKSFNSLILN